PSKDARDACEFLTNIDPTVCEARDNLILVKVIQAYQANKIHGPCKLFEEGDLVMLSMYHRQEIFKKSGEKQATK
ncbi:hypothetical protein F5876DRAFT_10374, partial [Lentinula aff. lateritia]